jgi:hypothetical protein
LLFESTNPGWVADANALHVAAQSSRVTLRTYGVRDQNEIQLALSGIDKDQVQALIERTVESGASLAFAAPYGRR